MLSFNTLRAANIARLPLFKNSRGGLAHSLSDGSDWSLGEWMCAILGELGEAANIVKKVRRGDLSLEAARNELANELADVVTYADLTMYQLKLRPNSHFENFEILSAFSSRQLPPIRLGNRSIGDWMTVTFGSFGRIAGHFGRYQEEPHLTHGNLNLSDYFGYSLANLDCVTILAGIDLGKAVRKKFNVVSARVGASMFIKENDTVSNDVIRHGKR